MARSNRTREDWGWWREHGEMSIREHEEIVHRWVWQDKKGKGDQVLPELRSPHDDDKCRWHSSQSSWIASEDSTRDWQNDVWIILAQSLLSE
jgi:hypothetical protein